MAVQIRKMKPQDREEILAMMRIFYASPAVLSNGSEQIFQNDVDACLDENPYLEGYVFAESEAILGYAMLAKSFSTEYGKSCIWIEDIYVKEAYRSKGIGGLFFDFLKSQYANCLFKLEVEAQNPSAMRFYQKHGFAILPYIEMKK